MVTSVDGIRAVVLALRTLLMVSVSPIHVSNTTPCGCLLALTFTILPIGYTLLPFLEGLLFPNLLLLFTGGV